MYRTLRLSCVFLLSTLLLAVSLNFGVQASRTGELSPATSLTLIVNDIGDLPDLAINGICDTSSAPGEQCTLRAAIQEANTATGSETITFSLPAAATITLNSALPLISTNISIIGPGASQLTITRSTAAGTPSFRILETEGSVALSGFTVTNGRTPDGFNGEDFGGSGLNGGGMLVNGPTATLTDIVVTANRTGNGGTGGKQGGSGGFGGGISLAGTVMMSRVVVSHNVTGNGGEGIPNGTGGRGGGIYSNGPSLTMIDCVVDDNIAGNAAAGPFSSPGFGADGGGILIESGTASFTRTKITNNSAGNAVLQGNGKGGDGGGLLTRNGVNSSLTDCIVSNNSSGQADSSSIVNAEGGSGGGIFNGGPMTITRSLISGNQTKGFGTTINALGGGIYNNNFLTLIDTTVSNNRTDPTGGQASGGGIYHNLRTMTVVNCTITGNQGTSSSHEPGQGISSRQQPVILLNTIVAGNNNGAQPDISGTFTSQGHNLIGRSDSSSTGLVDGTNNDQMGTIASPVNPLLGPLSDNGGFSQTHALLVGSPALDAGDNSATGPPFNVAFDQRGPGFVRLADGPDADLIATVDIGSVETQPVVAALGKQTTNEDTTINVALDVTGLSINSITATSTNSDLVPNEAGNISIIGAGNTRAVSITPRANAFGLTTIDVEVNTTSGTQTGSFELIVKPVADTPSVTGSTTNEDTQSTSGLVISRNVVDGDEVTAFKITNITNGSLFLHDGVTPVANGSFITFAQGNAGLRFTPPANTNDSGSFSVQAATGNTDDAVGGSIATALIVVVPVNDAPSFTNAGDVFASEDGGFITVPNWATNISAGPANEAGQTLTFQITGNTNTALFSTQPAISNSGILTFAPAANANGTAVLTAVLIDNGGTANGGVDTSSAQVFQVNVSAINDAPVNIVPFLQVVPSNTSLVFSTGNNNAIGVTDVDATNAQVSLAVTNGSLSLNGTNGLSFQQGDGTADPSMSFTGTLPDLNAAISGMTFTPPANFQGFVTLQITTNDLGNTGVGGAKSDSDNLTIQVLANGGVFRFLSTTLVTDENAGAAIVTVQRTGDISLPATVGYETTDHSESNGILPCSTINSIASSRCDFTTAIGVLEFAAGENSRTFKVLISQDSYAEGSEGLQLNLSNPSTGAVLGTPASATLLISDDPVEPNTNLVNDPVTFVTHHYHDFLNREPDQAGLTFWTNEIFACGSNAQCIEAKRVNVSAAFFLSIEYQQTGFLIYRTYKAAFGNLPDAPVPVRFIEYLPDAQRISRNVQVGTGNWEAQLESNKVAYLTEFVSRQRFLDLYSTILTPTQFVDLLFINTGIAPINAERQAAIDEFGGSADSSDKAARVRALRRIAENQSFTQAEFNRAFVLMQYFGYLRRNPDANPDVNYDGWQFWLNKLNGFSGNFADAEMVKAFIVSTEYRSRFGPQ